MQIKAPKSLKAILFCLTVSLFLSDKVTAQDPCTCDVNAQVSSTANLPQPNMSLRTTGEHRRNFEQNKRKHLNLPGKQQNDTFFLGNFLGLLTYLDTLYKDDYRYLSIYLCAYKEGTSHTKPGNEGKITLVFAPGRKDGNYIKDLGEYFHIAEDGPAFDVSQVDSFMIDTTELDKWHSNFVYLYMDKLATTVDRGDDNDEDGKKRDTRAIRYFKPYLCQLVNEQKASHTISGRAVSLSTDLVARLAAFGANEKEYKKRLFVQLDFWDNDEKRIVDLDSTDGFERRDAAEVCDEFKQFIKPVTLDNGQLCPPSRGCPSRSVKPGESN